MCRRRFSHVMAAIATTAIPACPATDRSTIEKDDHSLSNWEKPVQIRVRDASFWSLWWDYKRTAPQTQAHTTNDTKMSNTSSSGVAHVSLPSTPLLPAPQGSQHTALQWGIMILVLGSSAGLTLYTKKSASMLSTMNKIASNQRGTRGPRKAPQ